MAMFIGRTKLSSVYLIGEKMELPAEIFCRQFSNGVQQIVA